MTDSLRDRIAAAIVSEDDIYRCADAVIAALPELTPESVWRASMNETRPDYILAIRAQALDKVQELIEPYENDAAPHPEAWAQIVEAAFPPPPMAGWSNDE